MIWIGEVIGDIMAKPYADAITMVHQAMLEVCAYVKQRSSAHVTYFHSLYVLGIVWYSSASSYVACSPHINVVLIYKWYTMVYTMVLVYIPWCI